MPDMKDKVTNTQDKQKQRGLVQRDICRETLSFRCFSSHVYFPRLQVIYDKYILSYVYL